MSYSKNALFIFNWTMTDGRYLQSQTKNCRAVLPF